MEKRKKIAIVGFSLGKRRKGCGKPNLANLNIANVMNMLVATFSSDVYVFLFCDASVPTLDIPINRIGPESEDVHASTPDLVEDLLLKCEQLRVDKILVVTGPSYVWRATRDVQMHSKKLKLRVKIKGVKIFGMKWFSFDSSQWWTWMSPLWWLRESPLRILNFFFFKAYWLITKKLA